MEISGVLKNGSVIRLLEQAQEEEQTGVLLIKGEHGMGEVHLEEGWIYAADAPGVRERLGHRLVQEGALRMVELYEVLRSRPEGAPTLLGEALAARGLLPPERVERVVEDQIREAVLRLAVWEQGRFAFKRAPAGDAHRTRLRPRALFREERPRIEALRGQGGAAVLERIQEDKAPWVQAWLRGKIDRVLARAKHFEPRVRIVLVEGDPKWRLMVQDELSRQDFQVKGVSSPDKAQAEIERLVDKGYSPVVVTDIDFPRQQKGTKLAGLAFMEALHRRHPRLPMVVSTAYPISNLRRKILFLGGIFCLVKPDLSILSARNVEQVFQAFVKELVFCLDFAIHQYYQDYFHERGKIVQNELIEDLYNTAGELVHLGDQAVEAADHLRRIHEVSRLLAAEGDVDRAVEAVLEEAARHYDHVALFTWNRKYLNGFAGRSRLRADFGDRVQGISADYARIPFLASLREAPTLYQGPPPDEPAHREFLSLVTGAVPAWHLLYPVTVLGRVVGLWYADRGAACDRDPYAEVLVTLANMVTLAVKMQVEEDATA